ncbi:MAG: hypothetical protein ACYDGR_03115 [Candidatus Dormibacteria bacterium]
MNVVGSLGVSFFLCLLLVLAIDAVRHGRWLYLPAAVGIAVTLLAHMATGAMPGLLNGVLKFAGVGLAVVIVLIDLLFEEVDAGTPDAASPAPPIASGS